MFGELLYMVAGLAAYCWLAVLFFRRKAKFPRSWMRVNVVLAILSTLNATAIWHMWQQFPDLWKREEVISEFRSAFYGWIVYCSPLRHQGLEQSTLWLTTEEVSHVPTHLGCPHDSQDRAAGLAGHARGRNLH